MDINLEFYKVFCEVCKYRNISKAAESLHISQPAITKTIKKLEDSLGGVLFYRKNKGVELTAEGENLYKYINTSIATIKNAESIFSQYINLERGKIRIGGWDTLLISYMVPILIKFLQKHPNIEVSTHTGSTQELMQELNRGELDVLVCDLPYNINKYSNIEVIPLKKPIYCFFATSEFLKKNKIKSIEDAKSNQLMLPKSSTIRGKILKDYCKKRKIDYPQSNYEIVTIGVMKNLVINNLGVGFTNKEDIKDLLEEEKVVIIEELEDRNTQEGFAVLKKELTNSCTLQLIKEIREYYKI